MQTLNETEIDSNNWADDTKQFLTNWVQYLETGDVAQMCESKAQDLGKDSEDAQMWRLIASSSGTLEDVTKSLGFDQEDIVSRTEKFTGKTHRVVNRKVSDKGEGFIDQSDARSPTQKGTQYNVMSDNQLGDFFDNLGGDEQPDPEASAENRASTRNLSSLDQESFYNLDVDLETLSTNRNKNWFSGTEDLIRRNILVGNFDGAIDCCMKAQRFPEAFVVAYIKFQQKGDMSAVKTVLDEFMNTTNEPFINFLLQGMAEENWETVVQGSDLIRWKETASAVCSNVNDRNRKNSLLKRLASRLFANKNKSAGVSLGLLSGDALGVIDLLLQDINEVFVRASFEDADRESENGGPGDFEKMILSEEGKNIILIENVQKVFAICESQGIRSNNPLLQLYLVRFGNLALDYAEPRLAMTVLNS
jgi:hypothetical protein